MHDVPDCRQDLPGDGHLHFHFVLVSNDSLEVTEFVEEAPLRLGCGPGAFDESFPLVSVAMRDAPCHDLAGTFLVARFQPAPGHKVGGVLE